MFEPTDYIDLPITCSFQSLYVQQLQTVGGPRTLQLRSLVTNRIHTWLILFVLQRQYAQCNVNGKSDFKTELLYTQVWGVTLGVRHGI